MVAKEHPWNGSHWPERRLSCCPGISHHFQLPGTSLYQRKIRTNPGSLELMLGLTHPFYLQWQRCSLSFKILCRGLGHHQPKHLYLPLDSSLAQPLQDGWMTLFLVHLQLTRSLLHS